MIYNVLYKVFEVLEKNICFNYFKWIKFCVVVYEYVLDIEEVFDFVMLLVDIVLLRFFIEFDLEMLILLKEILEEMRKM